jgi:hypothetical protein
MKETITWERYVCDHHQASEQEAEEYGVKPGEWIDHEETVELPAKYEVCGRCRGKGTHSNPSIDGNGISAEEFYGPDWDDESREMYLTGGYDVTCHECDGKRVVLVLDEERCDPELLKAYLQHQREMARMDAEDRAIRYMESGGHDY